MKKLLIILLVFCAACDNSCEHQNISNCGYACKEAKSRMISYSKDGGCVCEPHSPCPNE